MTTRLLTVVTTLIAVAAGTAMIAAPGQFDRPGPTKARVWIENRNRNEAIPVFVLQNLQSDAGPVPVVVQNMSSAPVPVRLMKTPTAELPILPVSVARQNWEYYTLNLEAGQNPTSPLTRLGAEGWETTGVQVPNGSATFIVLKRPRP